ncbi:MobF family relaxase, partial [Bradyrhizobium sp. NBAIM08]|uniref:MobF family relaxase n=1 Tax=Bradyrhizobium sp. NBAIM08 TaxID=2793815 RepID=UPI001CD557EF
FEHGTSRAQDPQLHTHALALNACIRDDGTTGTIRSKPFFTHQMAASAIYRQELSYQIYTRLHLKSHQHKNWFEIDGIPEKLIEEFSKRRLEIEEQARKKGINTEHGYDITTLKTREEKQVVPREELFRNWQETGNQFNFSTPELTNLINDSKAYILPTQD